MDVHALPPLQPVPVQSEVGQTPHHGEGTPVSDTPHLRDWAETDHWIRRDFAYLIATGQRGLMFLSRQEDIDEMTVFEAEHPFASLHLIHDSLHVEFV